MNTFSYAHWLSILFRKMSIHFKKVLLWRARIVKTMQDIGPREEPLLKEGIQGFENRESSL